LLKGDYKMKKLYMLGVTALLSIGLAACSSGGESQQPMDPNAEEQGVGGVDPAQPSDGMEEPSIPTGGDGAVEETESPEMIEEPETEPSTTDPASPSEEETSTSELAPAPEDTTGQ